MRGITVIVTIIVTVAVGAMYLKPSQSDTAPLVVGNTYYQSAASSRDSELLDQFIASLDKSIMRHCVDDYDAGRTIDVDLLSTCGDFDIYASYLRISKFQAVKKFEHALLRASSNLEFEDRLTR